MVDCIAASRRGVVYNTCRDLFCSSNSHFCRVAQYQTPIYDPWPSRLPVSDSPTNQPSIVNCCLESTGALTAPSQCLYLFIFALFSVPPLVLVQLRLEDAGPARHMFRDSGCRPLSSPARARGRNASLWMGFDIGAPRAPSLLRQHANAVTLGASTVQTSDQGPKRPAASPPGSKGGRNGQRTSESGNLAREIRIAKLIHTPTDPPWPSPPPHVMSRLIHALAAAVEKAQCSTVS